MNAPHFQTVSLVLAGAYLVGCYAHASNKPLGASDAAGPSVAILPVQLDDVLVKVPGMPGTGSQLVHESLLDDYRQVVDETNSVLDHLSRGTRLLGPSAVRDRYARDPALQQLAVYFEDPGPVDEPWKAKGMSLAAARLGVKRFVFVHPVIELSPSVSSDNRSSLLPSVSTTWSGFVYVTVELFDLDPPRVISTATTASSFQQTFGYLLLGGQGPAPYGIIVPYGFGIAVDRSIEEATRKSFHLALSSNK